MRQLIHILVVAGIVVMFSRTSWTQHTEVALEDNKTITGTKIFDAHNVHRGNGTYSANEAQSGNDSHSAIESFTENKTHTGSETFSGLNNVVYVGGSITTWAGSDIGEQINSAYASCPATGCRIHILPGACYSFSTPIAFTTSNKPAVLEGDAGSTCLNYTPTTGTAITLDYGQNATGAGIRDIQLLGPGSGTSTTAISVGPTNGAINSKLEGLRIGGPFSLAGGFGTGVVEYSLGFHTTLTNFAISNSGMGLSYPRGIENIIVKDGVIDHCTTALNVAAANANSNIHLVNVAMDDNNTGINIPNAPSNPLTQVSCSNCHFENGSVGAAGSAYVVLNSGIFMMYGGSMWDDRASGTSAQMITAAGNSYISILGTLMFSNGINVRQAVNFSGTAHGVLGVYQSSLAISSIWNTSYTSGVVYDASLQASGAIGNLTRTIGSGTGATAGTAIASGASQTIAITVTGATTTDTATCSMNGSYPQNWAWISVPPPIVTANRVSMTFTNVNTASQTPGAATFRCTVFR